jgi:hypothetical protein
MQKIFILLLSLLLCRSAEANPRILCFDGAAFFGLTLKQRINLCTGATSDAPIRCYEYNVINGLTPDQKISLCQGARSDAPFRCFEDANNRGLRAKN